MHQRNRNKLGQMIILGREVYFNIRRTSLYVINTMRNWNIWSSRHSIVPDREFHEMHYMASYFYCCDITKKDGNSNLKKMVTHLLQTDSIIYYFAFLELWQWAKLKDSVNLWKIGRIKINQHSVNRALFVQCTNGK